MPGQIGRRAVPAPTRFEVGRKGHPQFLDTKKCVDPCPRLFTVQGRCGNKGIPSRAYARTSILAVWICPMLSRVSTQSGWNAPSGEAEREM